MNNYNIKFNSLLQNSLKKIIPRKEIHHHIAFFLDKKGNKIIIGENERFNPCSDYLSTHAEISALKNLRAKNFKFKRQSYDLLVIRLSPKGYLGESRPCYHCLQKLEQVNSGIKIKYIYYSTYNGNIIKEKFYLMKESNKTTYSSGYRRSMNRHS